jgi:hypothetical protein
MRDRPGKDPGRAEAQAMAQKYRVPVVVEVILEKVTNIATGTETTGSTSSRNQRHPEGLKGPELAVAGGALTIRHNSGGYPVRWSSPYCAVPCHWIPLPARK